MRIANQIFSESLISEFPGDEEYDPKAKSKTQKKKKAGSEMMPPPSSEVGRPNLYTMPEDNGYIFSNSMDLSFSGDAGAIIPSSQIDTYGFDDNLFGPQGAAVDGPDISDELAQALGEDWSGDQALEQAISPERNLNTVGEDLLTQATNGFPMDLDMDDNLHRADSAVARRLEPDEPPRERVSGMNTLYGLKLTLTRQLSSELDEGGLQNVQIGDPPTSPLVAAHLEGTLENAVIASTLRASSTEDTQQKPQKTRNKRKRENFLDGRTELTSDELKEIRETYLQRQGVLRGEMEAKRREREATLLFDQLLWAVPHDSEGFFVG